MKYGDVVRNMTDEELADFFTAIAKNSAEKLCQRLEIVDVDLSECKWEILTESHLEWLKQEVKDDR